MKNICNKYTKVNNDFTNTYHTKVNSAKNSPVHCKSCTYYISNSCRENNHDKITNEYNFFC